MECRGQNFCGFLFKSGPKKGSNLKARISIEKGGRKENGQFAAPE